jgi:large subunit ribosomal protein L5
MTPYLKTFYREEVVPALTKSQGYKNIHQVPGLEKVVLNTGVTATADKSVLTEAQKDLGLISGQKAVVTTARTSISNFKLRKGMPIGAKLTMRGDRMYEFFYRLVSIALPTIRDFRGVSPRLDGQGNYNIGISDVTIFPEISIEGHKTPMGLDVTIVTSAKTDDEGRELIRLLGMPFRRPETNTAASAA